MTQEKRTVVLYPALFSLFHAISFPENFQVLNSDLPWLIYKVGTSCHSLKNRLLYSSRKTQEN